MRLQPRACRALRLPDLAVAHLLGDFPAQPRRITVPSRRRDIEPLVRLHEVNNHACTGRMHHSQCEAFVRARCFRSHIQFSHDGHPVFFAQAVRNGGRSSIVAQLLAPNVSDLREKI